MSPTFSFRCPGCDARIRAPYQLVGTERACPGCGRRLVVRWPVREEQGPLLVPDESRGPWLADRSYPRM
jgi:DNA-directed RNA polymerase subunit RPC12/RpoP